MKTTEIKEKLHQYIETADEKKLKAITQWLRRISIIDRIKILIRDIDRDPFKGLGKPEPLKGNWTGYWSRRIDSEHRLIYKVTNEEVVIVKCKGHY